MAPGVGDAMDIKKKLILMGICVVIILTVLTINIANRIMDGDNTDKSEPTVKENIVNRAEAYRLLSYLKYDKEGREGINIEITYEDPKLSDWYDRYVNAVAKMGLIDGTIIASPMEALTYGECKEMIDRLILSDPQLQTVYAKLSFDFINGKEDMLIPDFIELFEEILNTQPKGERIVKKQTLLVLDQEVSEAGIARIVTDQGKYEYQRARDYSGYIQLLKEKKHLGGALDTEEAGGGQQANQDTDISEAEKVDNKIGDNASGNQAKPNASQGIEINGEDIRNIYLDKGIKALVCGKEIIYVYDLTTEEIVVSNVWIKQGQELMVDTYIQGINKSFQAKNKLSADIEKVVGDIAIEDGRIVGISVKPDLIKGKVLQSGDGFVEVEGYGRIPLDKDYRIYKLYGEISMEETNSILVGYETTDFVVSGGRISAALIRESIKAENIRVLLHTSDYKDIYHTSVELTATTDFVVKSGDMETTYEAGEAIPLKPGDPMLSNGRLLITPVSEKGKVKLLSIERSTGNPKYRGRIEIVESDKGLLIVNELPLEEYLYAVIPSEMPTYYGLESAKVQAVCARSYAYRHLMANSLRSYGAHVDDSVSYQVYNNIEENETSILAVKDTYGKVIKYKGDVIEAYYFSTSCGHTTGIESVWANGEPTPYLSGRLMAVEEEIKGVEAQNEIQKIYEELSKEENFRSFILDREFPTYESGYNWYRWNVTIKAKDIKKTIDKKLAGRYKANPKLILTLTKGSDERGDAVYESIPVETVGDIVDISVSQRGSGGIIYELKIIGTKNTIKVRTEYNIRALLSPIDSVVYRLDETGVDKLSLLPSAFFIIDMEKKSNQLQKVEINGGGYGHGVGMSQNGVKGLADSGKDYEEILTYFYQGTNLGIIYE